MLLSSLVHGLGVQVKGLKFLNPSPENSATAQILAHVIPATHMMTGRTDYPSHDGWIWVTQIEGGGLYPLSTPLSEKNPPKG